MEILFYHRSPHDKHSVILLRQFIVSLSTSLSKKGKREIISLLPPRLRTPWEQNQTSLKDDTHTDSVNSVCNWIGLLLTIQPPNSQTFADDNQQQYRSASRVVIKQLEDIHSTLEKILILLVYCMEGNSLLKGEVCSSIPLILISTFKKNTRDFETQHVLRIQR